MDNQVIYRVREAYEQLSRAETEHKTIPPLTDLIPGLTTEDAYQAQLLSVDQRIKDGQCIVGKKIGLTSVAMQQLLGVDQPDYGHLFDNMAIQNEGIVPIDRLLQPKVEGELAFILKKDLVGPNITLEDVLDATEYIVPSIEIVDSRISDWKIKLQDTIADNASCGLFVLGNQRFSPHELDLPNVEMKLYRNDQLMNTGKGSAVLGHPAICVAWLANKLHEYNVTLKAGEVILSGALSAMVGVEKGDKVTAEFTGLEQVGVTFS